MLWDKQPKYHAAWEYLAAMSDKLYITSWLNKLGLEGWELVTIQGVDRFIFKRRLKDRETEGNKNAIG